MREGEGGDWVGDERRWREGRRGEGGSERGVERVLLGGKDEILGGE